VSTFCFFYQKNFSPSMLSYYVIMMSYYGNAIVIIAVELWFVLRVCNLYYICVLFCM